MPAGPRGARVERSESMDGGEHSATLIDVMAVTWIARDTRPRIGRKNFQLNRLVIDTSIQPQMRSVPTVHSTLNGRHNVLAMHAPCDHHTDTQGGGVNDPTGQ